MSAGPSDVEGTDETDDDRQLMRRHLDGDPQAFGLLVERHRDRLWAVALRTLADREEAADAVQDALVSAYRRADSYRGEAAVTTWLHRIVVNACLDRMRRRKARPTSPLPEHEDTSDVLGDAVVDDPAEQTERRSIVMAALAQLSDDHRRAVVLVDMEGYSVEEAAELLGCPTGTVKSRCARARARLVPLLWDLRADGGNRERSRPVVSAGDIPTHGAGGEQS
uniref:RNA polymerase ECF-type sigma factor n=1 Tax=uncultured Nocardioidaceae bacterium TaxID=253824 RepID=A0A6J4KZS8_9ACTN|nr:MAG: RNA polymerase ECF-type sigma factor [uncultured Nocardioidaceae bacterium]